MREPPKQILSKANRNLGDRKAAVIYRRGVRVREFEASDLVSLFDYNLNDLSIDEARKASDWDVRHHCARALAAADADSLAVLFEAVQTGKAAWELTFDKYSLAPTWDVGANEHEERKKRWQVAFDRVAGDRGVLTTKDKAGHLERKGFEPVEVPEPLMDAASQWGVRTPAKVLSPDENAGRQLTEPTQAAQAAVDFVWGVLTDAGMTNGKERPPVKCFVSILDAGCKLLGYCRNGEGVFINADIATGSGEELSDVLVQVALEEASHWCTGATDNSRDFQDFLLALAVKLARPAVLA